MGFRFRKSIRIMPGVHLNLSKTGVSASIGRPGATVNIGPRGTKETIGLPGSGMSYSEQQTWRRPSVVHRAQPDGTTGHHGSSWLYLLAVIVFLWLMAHH